MTSMKGHPIVDRNSKAFELTKSISSKSDSMTKKLGITCLTDIVNAKNSGAHIIYYEDLVRGNFKGLFNVLSDWGVPLPRKEKVLESFKLPSSTVHEWSDLRDIESKLGRWKSQLSDDEVIEIFELSERFGVEDYGTSLESFKS